MQLKFTKTNPNKNFKGGGGDAPILNPALLLNMLLHMLSGHKKLPG